MKAADKGWLLGSVIGALAVTVPLIAATEAFFSPLPSRGTLVLIYAPTCVLGSLVGGLIGRRIAIRRADKGTTEP